MKFPLGQVVMTPGAEEVFVADSPAVLALLDRHKNGDWGDVDRHDKAANDAAVQEGTRILSAYTVNGTKLWIITEADRSATTILLPEEY